MLYWLFFEKLYPHFTPFRIFGYVTFRTLAASLTALLVALFLGPWMIRRLRELQIGQHIRDDGPESHQKKAGTPTMGGLLIITAVVIPTLLFTNLTNPYVWVALFGLLGYGGIGFLDDWSKVKQGRNLGLTGRQKMGLQVLLVLLLGVCCLFCIRRGCIRRRMNVPFFKNWRPGY